jgi:hypothetical protein
MFEYGKEKGKKKERKQPKPLVFLSRTPCGSVFLADRSLDLVSSVVFAF